LYAKLVTYGFNDRGPIRLVDAGLDSEALGVMVVDLAGDHLVSLSNDQYGEEEVAGTNLVTIGLCFPLDTGDGEPSSPRSEQSSSGVWSFLSSLPVLTGPLECVVVVPALDDN
jgi:hypothetical protein